MIRKLFYIIPIIFILAGSDIVFCQNSVVNTKHNLSVCGPGEIKSTTETKVCIFCHAPHSGGGQTPLWNRYANQTAYTLYSSPTMQTSTQQLELNSRNSRLCLSCHDGLVSLGLVTNREEPISFPAGLESIPAGYRTHISDDLSDDHPLYLDFNPHPSGEFACRGCHTLDLPPRNLECSSCHNPHDNSNKKFLVEDPIYGGICDRCHDRTGWTTNVHRFSPATWNGTPPNPWPSAEWTKWTNVAENSCNSCHNSHGNPSEYWLLKHSAEEENCNVCHNGNVAEYDIEQNMLKISAHPMTDYNNIHRPNEDPLTMARHVECTDCHNPHQVDQSGGSPPYITGSLDGVLGVDDNGNVVAEASFEYEVCYKCHQNSTGSTTHYVPRVDAQSSIRQEFSDANPSYHPVVGQGQNPNVPSLISPYDVNSIIYCTDCHNNDEADIPGSANGPHGSYYEPILKNQLIFSDGNPESPTIYALCYQCHDQSSILNDESGFPHARHVSDVQASCTTCHDSHGSYSNSHLINFNSDYVSTNGAGRLEFIDNGIFSGECSLRCHENNHEERSY